MSKEIFARLSVSDFLLSKEDADRLPSYVDIKDEDGNVITSVEVYLVTYEDEDGDECEEDGTPL